MVVAGMSLLLSDLDDAVLRDRDGALDEEQVQLGVDAVDVEADLRHAAAAEPAGHPHALEDARGVADAPIEPGLRMLCEPCDFGPR